MSREPCVTFRDNSGSSWHHLLPPSPPAPCVLLRGSRFGFGNHEPQICSEAGASPSQAQSSSHLVNFFFFLKTKTNHKPSYPTKYPPMKYNQEICVPKQSCSL